MTMVSAPKLAHIAIIVLDRSACGMPHAACVAFVAAVNFLSQTMQVARIRKPTHSGSLRLYN